MSLALESRHVGSVYVVKCAGRIASGEESKVLDEALQRGLREFNRIVLNLAEVKYIDSAGMGLLVRFLWHLRNRHGDLRLAESGSVRDQPAGDDQAVFGVSHLSPAKKRRSFRSCRKA